MPSSRERITAIVCPMLLKHGAAAAPGIADHSA